MANPRLTCKKIIEEVLKGGGARERIAQRVFEEYKGFVYDIIKQHRLPYEVGFDAYTEAVTSLISIIEDGRFNPISPKSCSTFIYRICHNKCVDYIRKNSKKPYFEYLDDLADPGEYEPAQEDRDNIMKYLLDRYSNKLGDRGRKVIELSMQGYTAKEIATLLGYKNANSVAFTKSKYLKDLRKLVERDMENGNFSL